MDKNNKIVENIDDFDDSEDEDYVPAQDKTCAGDSDVEENVEVIKSKCRKRKNATRTRTTHVSNTEKSSESSDDEDNPQGKQKIQVKESDWSDFLNKFDKPKQQCRSSSTSCTNVTVGNEKYKLTNTSEQKKPNKIFEFAGETIEVQQKDKSDINLKQSTSQDNTNLKQEVPGSIPSTGVHAGLNIISLPSAPRGLQDFLNKSLGKVNQITDLQTRQSSGGTSSGRGISSILDKIDQRGKKLSVLDKSKLDWDHFKNRTGIEEELRNANNSKACYTDRTAFLDRVDWNTFEKEKQVRDHERKKRFNAEAKYD